MSHLQLDGRKMLQKWSPVFEKLGIKNEEKKEWLAEYCEYHSLIKSGAINESGVAYANVANVAGMGAIVSPGIAAPGLQGTAGTDLATTFLDVAMQVAAQTIGLDLVSTKPTPGPAIDLPFLNYKYDDVPAGSDEKPQLFKVEGSNSTAVIAFLTAQMASNGVTRSQSGISKRMWFHFSSSTSNDVGATYNVLIEPTGSKAGWLEFIGFSRIDGLPIFRAYRQVNTASAGGWTFDATKNTFGVSDVITTVLNGATLEDPSTGTYDGSASTAFGTVTSSGVQQINAMEDHIPGYTTNWNKTAMSRGEDDQFYPGIIAPDYTVRRITVGSIEITSALRRTEMEDIKAQTGIDILKRTEAVLINELAQTISKEIVAKVFALGEQNRLSAPAGPNTSTISGVTEFDFDVDDYMSSANVPGGETSHAVARKLISRINSASLYIAVEGRIGEADYMVTNGQLASTIKNNIGYTLNPVAEAKIAGRGQVYPVGSMGGIAIYVDPNMRWDDKRIALGRKNKVDEPGILFVPYLMAQNVTIISEATWAPRMLLRSRYAVAEVGFYPWKQFMVLYVKDTNNVLN